MIIPGKQIFVVSDGRTDESSGLSLYELACFMKDLGVNTAYNLDGGGSSTMVFNGELVNNPTSGRAPCIIPDAPFNMIGKYVNATKFCICSVKMHLANTENKFHVSP